MPRKIFRRFENKARAIKHRSALAPIAHLLDDPNLFHLNRHSVTRAFAIGAGVAMLPIFGHLLIAAMLAIWRKANLGICLVVACISNPLTMPAILYIEYKLGSFILNRPDSQQTDWAQQSVALDMTGIWQSLLVGGAVLTIFSAFISYYLVKVIWSLSVRAKWKQRKLGRRLQREEMVSS